jgi:hypothetical protein
MQELRVESAFGSQLTSLAGQTVLCDADGRALGFFTPLPNRPKVEELQLESPLSIEQTEELRKVKTGKPLEEILARLGVA